MIGRRDLPLIYATICEPWSEFLAWTSWDQGMLTIHALPMKAEAQGSLWTPSTPRDTFRASWWRTWTAIPPHARQLLSALGILQTACHSKPCPSTRPQTASTPSPVAALMNGQMASTLQGSSSCGLGDRSLTQTSHCETLWDFRAGFAGASTSHGASGEVYQAPGCRTARWVGWMNISP